MPAVGLNTAFSQMTGIIQQVDPLGREIRLVADGREVTLDVPRECPIFLHGERVKLRILQPTDFADVLCTRVGDALVACSVRVNGWIDSSEELRQRRALGVVAEQTRGAR